MAQSNRRAETTTIGGGAVYAKVAERMKLFREDCPKGKHESAYELDVDGSIVFTVWLWKDKTDLLELMKAGVSDKDILRSSADANGNARSANAIVKEAGSNKRAGEKEFEKLESIALGRALANLGYLASGEIASSEEMEEFERYKKQQEDEAAQEFISKINDTKTQLEMNKMVAAKPAMLKNRVAVEAMRAKQAEFAAAAKKPEELKS